MALARLERQLHDFKTKVRGRQALTETTAEHPRRPTATTRRWTRGA
jgi:hypothetical protein